MRERAVVIVTQVTEVSGKQQMIVRLAGGSSGDVDVSRERSV